MSAWLIVLAAFLVGVGWYLYRSGDNSIRKDALKRALLGAPYLALLFVLGTLFGAILVGTWILDVLWQLITGREGVAPNGAAQRLWDWRDENTRYIIYGDGSSFRWVP